MAPKHIFFTIYLGYREFPVTYRSYLKSALRQQIIIMKKQINNLIFKD